MGGGQNLVISNSLGDWTILVDQNLVQEQQLLVVGRHGRAGCIQGCQVVSVLSCFDKDITQGTRVTDLRSCGSGVFWRKWTKFVPNQVFICICAPPMSIHFHRCVTSASCKIIRWRAPKPM